jgi:putative transposase
MQNKSYKFRLYPNKTQEVMLAKTFGCVRFIWNKELEKFQNKDYSKKLISEYRKEHEFLKEVSACVLEQKKRDFEETKKQLFSKTRKKKLGTIRFKSKKDLKQSFRIDNRVKIVGKKVVLEKIGKIPIVLHRQIHPSSKIKSATVSKNSCGQYFVSILVEEDIQEKAKTGKTVGLDVGIKSLVTTSDNQAFENPKWFRDSQTKLARLQLWHSKKQKGSVRREKLRLRIAKLHNKVANQRSHYLHNVSSFLINNYDSIIVEDLNVDGMIKNCKLSKSIQDASWSQLFGMLEYKSQWYGRDFIKISPKNTSRVCSSCGCIKEDLKLSDRIYECSPCGEVIDRDYNAALNIHRKAYGLTDVEGSKFDSDETFISLKGE